MNKLYHSFCVYAYKGGELHSNINQTIEDIVSNIYVDWKEICEICADHERFANVPDEEFFSLSCVQLLDMLDDETLKDIAEYKIYPGNSCAFDSRSDSEVYTVNDEGELIEVNIINEPGFMEAFRKCLHEEAKQIDDRDKNHKNNE